MIFSAKNNYDDVCMYLSLRTKNIDEEDEDGLTVFFIMLQRNEIDRCKQLLRRGSNINHVNKNGITAIHLAVEKKLPEKSIRFLIDSGAQIHFIDKDGFDACDKVRKDNLYPNINQFYDNDNNKHVKVKNQR